MGEPLFFISAGDLSGDNATSRVVAALRQKSTELQTFGLGGRRLKHQGQEQLADPHDLTVLGFWEVARRYAFFRRLMHQCVREIKKRRPSCILLVDYPGFNLRLAKRVRELGIPIVYYISPQVWAWGKWRLRAIKDCIDLMLLILPFEEACYRESGVRTEFVGHYLLEDIPGDYVRSAAVNRQQLALLPGSRPQEIERMLPPMVQAAGRLHRERGTTAVVAGIHGAYAYDKTIQAFGGDGVSVSFDDSRKIMFESGLVLTASGTATLEAGIIGRPMVIVYKTSFITHLIARRLLKLRMIGLVNLVLGEKVVPELIQREVTADRTVAELEKYMRDDGYRNEVCTRLARVPELLGGDGASQRVAAMIGEYL